METPLNNRAQNRARVSVFFGCTWLVIGLTSLSFMLLRNGSLETMIPKPLSQAGVAMAKTISVIERTRFVLWVGSGIVCVITAFPEPKNPRSWQGKTAVFLASLVLLSFLLPAIGLMIWYLVIKG